MSDGPNADDVCFLRGGRREGTRTAYFYDMIDRVDVDHLATINDDERAKIASSIVDDIVKEFGSVRFFVREDGQWNLLNRDEAVERTTVALMNRVKKREEIRAKRRRQEQEEPMRRRQDMHVQRPIESQQQPQAHYLLHNHISRNGQDMPISYPPYSNRQTDLDRQLWNEERQLQRPDRAQQRIDEFLREQSQEQRMRRFYDFQSQLNPGMPYARRPDHQPPSETVLLPYVCRDNDTQASGRQGAPLRSNESERTRQFQLGRLQNTALSSFSSSARRADHQLFSHSSSPRQAHGDNDTQASGRQVAPLRSNKDERTRQSGHLQNIGLSFSLSSARRPDHQLFSHSSSIRQAHRDNDTQASQHQVTPLRSNEDGRTRQSGHLQSQQNRALSSSLSSARRPDHQPPFENAPPRVHRENDTQTSGRQETSHYTFDTDEDLLDEEKTEDGDEITTDEQDQNSHAPFAQMPGYEEDSYAAVSRQDPGFPDQTAHHGSTSDQRHQVDVQGSCEEEEKNEKHDVLSPGFAREA